MAFSVVNLASMVLCLSLTRGRHFIMILLRRLKYMMVHLVLPFSFGFIISFLLSGGVHVSVTHCDFSDL